MLTEKEMKDNLKYSKTIYFKFLDDLRISGITNMLGAVPYLLNEFEDLDRDSATLILTEWINSFREKESE